MNRAKTTLLLMARWLVVLTASLIVSAGNVSASAPAQTKSSCAESCAQRCPCCITKSAPVDSAPLAPTPSTRTAVAKDFQLAALCNALLLKEREGEVLVPSHFSAGHSFASLPLFVRHCTFLI
jgi:hypothetical protein